MTDPAPSGGSSPLKVGGLALLGVAAVAAIVGIGTLVSGGGDGSSATAAPPSTSAASGAATTSAAASAATTAPTTGVIVPSFPSPTAAVAAPGAGTSGAGGTGSGTSAGGGTAGAGGAGAAGAGGSGGGVAVAKAPVRVYNNSTITGLAARAADDFRSDGWNVDAVANYPDGRIPTSTVYYRPGTSEQAAAEAMGKAFGMRVEPRFTGLDEASPGLIAIVTNDYQKR
jgi:LytR cell envelope-related transcriptional attenuator